MNKKEQAALDAVSNTLARTLDADWMFEDETPQDQATDPDTKRPSR